LRGREGMGGGDARLLAAAGGWLGWQGLPSVLVLASLAALAIAGWQAARGHNIGASTRLPFGTYLVFGIFVVWLYGPLGGNGPIQF
jgi:leader peptidase (prepilin peptidase)/N-methyltransferase